MSPFDFTELPMYDGLQHPSDVRLGAKPRRAKILRYEADNGTRLNPGRITATRHFSFRRFD